MPRPGRNGIAGSMRRWISDVVGCRLAVGQHAQRDLRTVAVERLPRLRPRGCGTLTMSPGRGVHVADVGAVDPRMPALAAAPRRAGR